MVKYAWLNIQTGEFSNSWIETGNFVDRVVKEVEEGKHEAHWKLIKFECLTDADFEFSTHMKLR